MLLDLAGVVYQGGRLLPGAADAVGRVRDAGLPVRFVTNTSRRCRARLVADLEALGLPVQATEVFTAPLAVRAVLQARRLAPHLLVHPGVLPDFAHLPPAGAPAVVVGDAAEGFTYPALNSAFRKLVDGAPLLAVGRNRYFRGDDGLSLDAGPFVAALEYAAGVEAEVLGKPAPGFFRTAADDLGLDAGEVWMVGDDVEADVLGALDAGLGGAVLVGTGKCRPADRERIEGSAAGYAEDLASAVQEILI
ncbi:MAG: TIGR01458 family HAD-type hydrolase [Gammaproteobacteria bacterium]